jgi:hypothetical protein
MGESFRVANCLVSFSLKDCSRNSARAPKELLKGARRKAFRISHRFVRTPVFFARFRSRDSITNWRDLP